jgi:hypothetical protein
VRAGPGRATIGSGDPRGAHRDRLSSFLCVPSARSRAGGYTLGAPAGPAAMERVATDAGFTQFRCAAETPLNLVYEVRP